METFWEFLSVAVFFIGLFGGAFLLFWGLGSYFRKTFYPAMKQYEDEIKKSLLSGQSYLDNMIAYIILCYRSGMSEKQISARLTRLENKIFETEEIKNV